MKTYINFLYSKLRICKKSLYKKIKGPGKHNKIFHPNVIHTAIVIILKSILEVR